MDFDRRAEDKTTSNILILGNSGQGKSYLLKLILTNIRESGKSVLCLDPESEYEEICTSLGGCYIDCMSGEYTINPLEPKSFGASGDDGDDTACPAAFKKVTRLSQHKDLISEIISKINRGIYDNPKVEEMLLNLADRLSRTSGKKVYGYLKADVKAIIDSIIDEIASDERISALYNLWYEQRESVIKTYTDEMPERAPLSQNTEFKSIKNAVIGEAMNIIAERTIIEEDEIANENSESDSEPSDGETEPTLTDKEKTSLMWQYYKSAKDLLDRDNENYNPNEAVDFLIESAMLGCGVAKYRLGKMFLQGKDVSKHVDYALRWLEESVSEDNEFAEYLLGKTYLKGEDMEQDLIRAEDLLRKSSVQGNKYAKYTLGKSLLDGELFLQNIPEAIKLITESADNGFAPAQYLLGKLLYKGEMIPQDLKKAIEYLEKAAGQKNPYAAYLAGKIRFTEDAVKDIRKAIRNFEIGAENGNYYAEYMLVNIYLYGKDAPRDYDKAIA